MNKKTLSILLLLHLALLPLIAQTEKQKAVQQFVNNANLKHASIGFVVKDMSGKLIASHNPNNSYTPASILKVVTTATALEVLGADYRYKTTLAKDVNNPNRLLIRGYGDPTLGTEHLNNNQYAFVDTWASEIEKAFAPKKEIDITVVDNYFGYSGVSRKWIHEDLGNYYAAAAYGISVFDNTYRLSFKTQGVTSPEIISTLPEMKDLTFTNTLSLNTTGKDNGYILGSPMSHERVIIGDIPANRAKFTIKGDIPNPGLFLGETMAETLAAKGIGTGKVDTSYDTYYDEMNTNSRSAYAGEVFYTHLSPTLADIAKDVNVRSNNHYAEHLIRTLGRVQNPDIYSLALEDGIKKVETLWTLNGLKTDALFMYDGCGLAPNNAVSANFMTDILVHMQTKSKHAASFLATMPQAGKDGTVRNLLKGTRLDGKVFVKSGSIANVQCFAGYYINGTQKLAFTIMVNNYNGNRSQVVKAIEQLLLTVL